MSPKTLYGVAAILLAGLIITSTFGAYFYYQYGQQSQIANHYASDLSDSSSQYNQLASQFDSSLTLENQTLALLAGTVGAVNTTMPIYAQASSQLSGLWNSYLKLKPASAQVYSADILLNFGNGTRLWYNDTQVQPGWNLYTTTVVLTGGNMDATWYPSFGEHFVNGIEGVTGNANSYWIAWTYNSTASWQQSKLGADLLPVYNGSVFAWVYCGQTCEP